MNQLCLAQQHFDGTDYSQAAKSLLETSTVQEGYRNRNVQKYRTGGTGFEKGLSSQLYDVSGEYGMLKTTVQCILQDDLKKRKLCLHLVLQALTTEQ